MAHSASDSTHFHKLVIRGSIDREEMRSGQFISFCPTDAWQPDVNIYETAAAFFVCVDLAGMKPDQIQVDVTENTLMVRGQRVAPMPPDPGGEVSVHLMEINAGAFCREVEIPAAVDRGAVSAHYRNGLLWIKLIKTA